MVMIALNQVKKSFGAVPVLQGVSFSVEKGQVAALIGASGSGKSTALRCVDRLEVIDSGEIIVADHKVHDPKLDLHKLRLDVGIVFQSYNLFPHLTIEENVMLAPRSVKKIPKDEAREMARAALERVGLDEKANHYPEQLSGGQQQREALSRDRSRWNRK